MLSSFFITVILSACAASALHWLFYDWNRAVRWTNLQEHGPDDGWPRAFASAMKDIGQMPKSRRSHEESDQGGEMMHEREKALLFLADTEPDEEQPFSQDVAKRAAVRHLVPPDVSDFVIPEFKVGQDKCQIALTFPNIEFVYFHTALGVTLVFDDGHEQLKVTFVGVAAPPLADVLVAYDHPADGPRREALSQLVGDEELASLEVSPPETPVLLPLDEIVAPAEFHEFDAASEYVEIWTRGSESHSDILVRPSPDGRDALVVVDGRLSAVLRGAPNATARNVRLVPVQMEGQQLSA